jgi:hypothetical protein
MFTEAFLAPSCNRDLVTGSMPLEVYSRVSVFSLILLQDLLVHFDASIFSLDHLGHML